MNDGSDLGHGSLWWGILDVLGGDKTGCRRTRLKPVALALVGDDMYLS